MSDSTTPSTIPQEPRTAATAGVEARLVGIKKASQKRTRDAERKADAAIRDLLKHGADINFSSVARVGGVTTAFLHRHPELSARIRDLGAQQRTVTEQRHLDTAVGEGAVVGALRKRLRDQEAAHAAEKKELHARIKELENQVSTLYGKIGP